MKYNGIFVSGFGERETEVMIKDFPLFPIASASKGDLKGGSVPSNSHKDNQPGYLCKFTAEHAATSTIDNSLTRYMLLFAQGHTFNGFRNYCGVQ